MGENLVAAPQLYLLGHPRLIDGQGQRVELTSKKSVAVLGLLALANDGVRSRAWLQQKLWGSRDVKQAQNSLRRELANMRKTLPCLPLVADHRSVRLDLDGIWVDVLQRPGHGNSTGEEFLEGLDIAGEDDFEEWLRDARSQIAADGSVEGDQLPDEDKPARPDAVKPAHHEVGDADAQGGEPPTADGSAARPPATITVSAIDDPALIRREDAALLHFFRQELSAGLSRLGWLSVIAAPDGAASKPGVSPADYRQAARKDDARFVVSLSLIPLGPAPLLSVSCIEMPMRKIVWSEAAPLLQPLQQKDVNLRVGRTINALENGILAASRADIGNPEAIADADRAVEALRYFLPRVYCCTGLGLTDKLLRIAGGIATSHSEIDVFRAIQAVRVHWWQPQRGSFKSARQLAQAALARHPSDIRAIMTMGIVQKWIGNFDAAIRLFERVIAANPASASGYANLGAVCLLRGDNGKAMSMLRTAEALSPFDPEIFWIYGQLATAALMAGRYDEALRYAEDSMALQSRYILPALVAAYCHQLRGDVGAARDALLGSAMTRASPMADHALAMMPFEDHSAAKKLRSGLAALP